MQRDAAAFARFYEKLHYDIERYKTFAKEALAGEFRALVERFPQYDDFDLIGTRGHVLYPDPFGIHDDEDVREHFRSIVRFQALNSMLDDAWSSLRATSDDDRKHLYDYSLHVRDAKFKKRLKNAIDIFYLARGDDKHSFDMRDFSVNRVSHIAEIRYGVHFKDTDEYGLYACFYGDRTEPYESYYRSDAMFQEQTWLDGVLSIDYSPAKSRW